MRKNKRAKVLTLGGIEKLWRVKLPDGRKAELMARSKKAAAEQAAAVWALPVDWLRQNARITELA